MYAVFRIVWFHVTISQTNGKVCVRVRGDRQFHFAQTTNISFVQQSQFLIHVLELGNQFIHQVIFRLAVL